MKVSSQLIFTITIMTACCAKQSINTNSIISMNGKNRSTLEVKGLKYERKIYCFNGQDSLDGYWRMSYDTLLFIPSSRVEQKDSLTPFPFAVLTNQDLFTPACSFSYNKDLIGIVYQAYINSNLEKNGRYLVSHKLHDGADRESEELTEVWIKTRVFEIDDNGEILNMKGDFSREGSLYCYD